MSPWYAGDLRARVDLTTAAVMLSCLLCAFACSTGPKGQPIPPESPELIGEPYHVGPSDTLLVRVLPEPVIERRVKVRPDGRFSFDLIGDVDAAGRTTGEIAQEIDRRMSQYRNAPSTSISLVLPASTAVTVLGEVKTPSSFPLERPLRLSEAVARAGGVTNLAAASRVRVIRHPKDAQAVLYLVNLDQIDEGKAETNMLVQPGDLIFVPPAVPVAFGYAVARVLFPVEQVTRALFSPFAVFATLLFK